MEGRIVYMFLCLIAYSSHVVLLISEKEMMAAPRRWYFLSRLRAHGDFGDSCLGLLPEGCKERYRTGSWLTVVRQLGQGRRYWCTDQVKFPAFYFVLFRFCTRMLIIATVATPHPTPHLYIETFITSLRWHLGTHVDKVINQPMKNQSEIFFLTRLSYSPFLKGAVLFLLWHFSFPLSLTFWFLCSPSLMFSVVPLPPLLLCPSWISGWISSFGILHSLRGTLYGCFPFYCL